jgi:hypothetical protein
MNDDPDIIGKFGLILSQLAVCYIDGYSSVRILGKLLEFQRENPNKYVAMSYFLNHLYALSYQSTIMNLSNIIIHDKDSINIRFMLLFFENNLYTANNDEFELNMRMNINKLINLYPRESELYRGVKDLRDKYIAHIDKGRLFIPQIELPEKIQITDMKIAYEKVGALIYKIAQDFGINLEVFDYDQWLHINHEFDFIIEKFPEREF